LTSRKSDAHSNCLTNPSALCLCSQLCVRTRRRHASEFLGYAKRGTFCHNQDGPSLRTNRRRSPRACGRHATPGTRGAHHNQFRTYSIGGSDPRYGVPYRHCLRDLEYSHSGRLCTIGDGPFDITSCSDVRALSSREAVMWAAECTVTGARPSRTPAWSRKLPRQADSSEIEPLAAVTSSPS